MLGGRWSISQGLSWEDLGGHCSFILLRGNISVVYLRGHRRAEICALGCGEEESLQTRLMNKFR